MDDGNNTILVCLQSIPETLGHHRLQGLHIFSLWQQSANPSHVTSNKKSVNKSIHKSGSFTITHASKNSRTIYYSEYGFIKTIHYEKFTQPH